MALKAAVRGGSEACEWMALKTANNQSETSATRSPRSSEKSSTGNSRRSIRLKSPRPRVKKSLKEADRAAKDQEMFIKMLMKQKPN